MYEQIVRYMLQTNFTQKQPMWFLLLLISILNNTQIYTLEYSQLADSLI